MHNFRLKYAPKTLGDVVFPSQAAEQIITDMVELKRLNHLILFGSYGTGKTTVAELIPKRILGYKQGVDCIKFDADHESGVDNIRDLNRFVSRVCIGDKNVKFVIIDEVDGLSQNAQKALRGVLNTADKTDTFFI
ncbi:MAG: AAA family ATPase, partial [Maribacter arcticus]|uniref:AAA family ATPase n=1 Tax=Maribacter arcticus TaxID=561365 RepID=UPI0030018AEC